MHPGDDPAEKHRGEQGQGWHEQEQEHQPPDIEEEGGFQHHVRHRGGDAEGQEGQHRHRHRQQGAGRHLGAVHRLLPSGGEEQGLQGALLPLQLKSAGGPDGGAQNGHAQENGRANQGGEQLHPALAVGESLPLPGEQPEQLLGHKGPLLGQQLQGQQAQQGDAHHQGQGQQE